MSKCPKWFRFFLKMNVWSRRFKKHVHTFPKESSDQRKLNFRLRQCMSVVYWKWDWPSIVFEKTWWKSLMQMTKMYRKTHVHHGRNVWIKEDMETRFISNSDIKASVMTCASASPRSLNICRMTSEFAWLIYLASHLMPSNGPSTQLNYVVSSRLI